MVGSGGAEPAVCGVPYVLYHTSYCGFQLHARYCVTPAVDQTRSTQIKVRLTLLAEIKHQA